VGFGGNKNFIQNKRERFIISQNEFDFGFL